jgi:hypothetical protein
MSENYKLYRQKMAERRNPRRSGSLRDQLMEIFDVVRDCEARWSLDDRMERRLGWN